MGHSTSHACPKLRLRCVSLLSASSAGSSASYYLFLGARNSALAFTGREGIAPALSAAFRRNFTRNNSITVDSTNQTASSLPSGAETPVRSCVYVRSSAENQKQKDHRQIKVWTGYLGVTSCSPLVSLVIGCAAVGERRWLACRADEHHIQMRLALYCPSGSLWQSRIM